MRREFHVRFCEGPGVRFPRATRLVMVFQTEEDARAMRTALAERLASFGLELHPASLLLLVQHLDGRHFFALKVFEAGAAAGGDVGHLVG
jgi:hypothetical protein